MLSLFNRPKQLLDQEIIQWIFDSFAWSLKQFDKDVFFQETVLVIPDNKYFPGKETSASGMAELIFSQVKQYAGMSHWPTKLHNLEHGQPPVMLSNSLTINGALRGKKAQLQESQSAMTEPTGASQPVAMPVSTMDFSALGQVESKIPFTYHPQQLRSPEGIISHFAHGLSHHLASTATELPPGGAEYVPMAGELVGIFMGFGIMFANSAVVPRTGGCGGCGGGQSPVRQVFLNEEEATYALAVFCHLKSIEAKRVTKHLKKHLRGFFKDAMKDCKRRLAESDQLKLSA